MDPKDADAVAKGEEKNKKRNDQRTFKKYGVAGKPLAATRKETNKKRCDTRRIKTQARHAAEAAKPVDAKDAKRKETNKKHREWCKRKREEIKEASAFADNILTPAISPHI